MRDAPTTARVVEADLQAAVARFPWVEDVFSLELAEPARAHPDALQFAIVLRPYGIAELVETHYAVLAGLTARDVAGRVLYVNGTLPAPSPLARARRITLTTEEREAAHARIAGRMKTAASTEQRAELEHVLAQLREQASRDTADANPVTAGSPYRPGAARTLDSYSQEELQALLARAFDGSAHVSTFEHGFNLSIERDPFPSRKRPRLLVVDDDPSTMSALAALGEVDVVVARDGWTALDHLAEGDFDLVLCAVVLGEFSGARIHRMISKSRPAMAARMVFLAREAVVAQAPPSSASGRVLARPIDPAVVRALLTGGALRG